MKGFEHLMDNAATCCQQKLLIDNKSVRECVKLNVYDPMQAKVARLREHLTELRQDAHDCGIKAWVMKCDEALEGE